MIWAVGEECVHVKCRSCLLVAVKRFKIFGIVAVDVRRVSVLAQHEVWHFLIVESRALRSVADNTLCALRCEHVVKRVLCNHRVGVSQHKQIVVERLLECVECLPRFDVVEIQVSLRAIKRDFRCVTCECAAVVVARTYKLAVEVDFRNADTAVWRS